MNLKLMTLGIIGLFAMIFFFVGFSFCALYSDVTRETMIMDVTESDITYDDKDFYVVSPDGTKISLGIDGGEILDLTKHSRIIVRFERMNPVLLYPGTGWYVDGVVKTPNENMSLGES